MANNKKNNRTALLVRCSKDEARAIRTAAKRECRTISAYFLNAAMTHLAYQGQLPRRPNGPDQTHRKPEP